MEDPFMRASYFLVILFAIFLISGCIGEESITGGTTLEMRDTVENGDTIKVDYWLTVDGEQIDTSEGRGPFEFTVGSGQVIPGFDKAVLGMKAGETKHVTLSGEDAYTSGQLAGKTLNFKITILEIN